MQLGALVAAARASSPMMPPVITLLGLLGLRISEACSIDLDDFGGRTRPPHPAHHRQGQQARPHPAAAAGRADPGPGRRRTGHRALLLHSIRGPDGPLRGVSDRAPPREASRDRPARSAATPCATPTSPPPSTPASRCATSRSPPATPTPAPPPVTTRLGATSTGTRTTSLRPSSPRRLTARTRRCAGDRGAGWLGARQIAASEYVFLYPLVMMDADLSGGSTNSAGGEQIVLGPTNAFTHMRAFRRRSSRRCRGRTSTPCTRSRRSTFTEADDRLVPDAVAGPP